MLDSGDYAHVFMVKECDKNSGNGSGPFDYKNKHTISKWPLSDTNLIYILAYEIHILDSALSAESSILRLSDTKI